MRFRLVNAPSIEAAEIVEKLAAKDVRLGLTLTALRKYIKVFQTIQTIQTTPSSLTLSLLRKNNLRQNSSIGTVFENSSVSLVIAMETLSQYVCHIPISYISYLSMPLHGYLTNVNVTSVRFDCHAKPHGTGPRLVEPLRILRPQNRPNPRLRTIPHQCLSTSHSHSQETRRSRPSECPRERCHAQFQ